MSNTVSRVAIAAVLAMFAVSSGAADFSWNSDSGLFDTLENWTLCPPASCAPLEAPSVADDVWFDLVDSSVLFSPGMVTNSVATVSGTNTTFDLNGSAYNLAELRVGQSSLYNTNTDSTLNIRNGTVSVSSITLGRESGYTGEMNIVSGGHLANGTDTSFIGQVAGSIGAVNVDGATSRWDSRGISIGDYGQGSLDIANGGTVSANSWIAVGTNVGSIGSATVSGVGSLLESRSTSAVGNSGTGSLNISNGGRFLTTYGAGIIANNNGSTGHVVVDGNGSSWDMDYQVDVGNYGNGSLEVTNGGSVSSVRGYVARYAGSSGIATIDGVGSRWINSGFTYIGQYGSGALNIRNGGEVSNTSATIGYGSLSTGTVSVDGAGTLWTNNGLLEIGDSGQGSMTVTNGASVTSAAAKIGDDGAGIGTVSIDGSGSTWTLPSNGSLLIGAYGHGELHVSGGGFVSNGHSDIGWLGGSTGIVSVDGMGSVWETLGVNFHIGKYGNGTLSVTDGGSVTVSPNGFVGRYVGSEGKLTVSGADSTLTTDENVYVGGSSFAVGGSAEVIVEFGGTVNVGKTMAIWQTAEVVLASGNVTTGEGLTNRGLITTSGNSEVVGDFINTGDGRFIVSGGSTVTFYDAVTHNGAEFSVGAGAAAVFAEGYSGAGDILGQGTSYFEGGLNPGNSPALMNVEGNVVLGSDSLTYMELSGLLRGSEYDAIDVGESLSLSGILELVFVDGFETQLGDSFDLFTASIIDGGFSTHVLPELAGSLYWSTQVVTGVGGRETFRAEVVPIPASIWLFFSGLGLLGAIRRKKLRAASVLLAQRLV